MKRYSSATVIVLLLSTLFFLFQNQVPLPPLSPPTLADIFLRSARFQTIEEAQQVSLNFLDNAGVFGNKLPILFNPTDQRYYTYTRRMIAPSRFQIFMLSSSDGVTFQQVGAPLFDNLRTTWSLYDAHIAFDGLRYIMTLECSQTGVTRASVCISYSRTPFVALSWSQPKLVVENGVRLSASTGATVRFKGKTYVKWSLVDDGATAFKSATGNILPDDGNESTSTWANQLFEPSGSTVFLGRSGEIGKEILPARKNTLCAVGWDCNNIDVQDWKAEGEKIYAIYNGANYFRCMRPEDDQNFTNRWALSIRRSNAPLGDYRESSGILIDTVDRTKCGISYPVVNKVGGDTYLYYTYFIGNVNHMARSKLIWDNPLRVTDLTVNTSYRVAIGTRDDAKIEALKSLFVFLLDRHPTNLEMQPWLISITANGLSEAARSLLGSSEHEAKWSSRSTTAKVDSLYRALLLRAPDSAGLTQHQNAIDSGQSASATYEAFLSSPEFVQRASTL